MDSKRSKRADCVDLYVIIGKKTQAYMKILTLPAVTVAAGASFPVHGSSVPVYLQPPGWTNSGGADQLLGDKSHNASILLLEMILFDH